LSCLTIHFGTLLRRFNANNFPGAVGSAQEFTR
jgi:hypothetical protein